MSKTNQTENEASAKQYYTIGEVAEMLDLSVEVLRKWEHDFPAKIKPMRTKGNTRLYRARDIERLQMIKRMRENEGRTIEGVRRSLTNRPGQEETKQEVISRLTQVRSQLQGIVDELDGLLARSRWTGGTD